MGILPFEDLTQNQRDFAIRNHPGASFLEGPAGTGKTTAAIHFSIKCIEKGLAPHKILILLPQQTLSQPYNRAHRVDSHWKGTQVDILTFGSLAKKMMELFWPSISQEAGFHTLSSLPQFLSTESAVYFLSAIVKPLREKGYFLSLHISPDRLYAQILDNLNKSALVGFPVEEIADRLSEAWTGKPAQLHAYQEMQECALLFRQFCRENNLMDFSLLMESFRSFLWKKPFCRTYLRERYEILIYDNVEEDTPAAHDLVLDWLPDFRQVVLIQDDDGGFRTFLGADPTSARRLKAACDQKIRFVEPVINDPGLKNLGDCLSKSILHKKPGPAFNGIADSLEIRTFRFTPEMTAWICNKAADLISSGQATASDIVFLSPFLPGSLLFSMSEYLDRLGLKWISNRPSRSLQEEPTVRCLTLLAKLAHPAWGFRLEKLEVRSAFQVAFQNLDLVRADILADVFLQHYKKYNWEWKPWATYQPFLQQRLTDQLGEAYENLRCYINNYHLKPSLEPDVFFQFLFEDILSRPGFGFYRNYDNASMVARLVASARRFRQDTQTIIQNSNLTGIGFLQSLEEGLLSSQFLPGYFSQPEDAILITPAYSFLMSNRQAKYQFWLNAGSPAWSERLFQPLAHPFVLSRNWVRGRKWTQNEEIQNRQENLLRLTNGLIRRCTGKITICYLEIDEQGNESRGPLLYALQRLLIGYRSSGESILNIHGELI